MNKKQAYTTLLIVSAITLFFGFQIKKLLFNDNFDLFFPQGDKDLAYYQNLTDEFGVYNDFLFISIIDSSAYSSAFLTRLEALTKKLQGLPETTSVLSPTNYKGFQITPFGLNRFNLIGSKEDLDLASIQNDEKLYGQFFGKDNISVGLLLRHQAFENKKLADQFYQKLTKLIQNEGFEQSVISGKIQAQHDFSLRLKNELGLLLVAAIILVIVMLSLVFRSVEGVIIPLITLFITLVWMVGFFGLVGKQIDVLSIMIPPILLVVSMSDVIHLCNKFNQLVSEGRSISKALQESIRLVGLATLLTSLTTAIGFFSLMVSPISPIKDFGLFTGIGIVFAFVVTFSTIPSLLFLLNKSMSNHRNGDRGWKKVLGHSFEGIMRQRKTIMAISIGLLVLCGFGTTLVKRNTFLIVGVDKSDPLMESMNYFDQYYDGNKPFEMTLELPSPEALFETSTLQTLERVQHYLQNEYGISHIESPLPLIKAINQAFNGGITTAYTLPSAKDYERTKRIYNSRQLRELKGNVQSKDGITLRINGRGQDIGSAKSKLKNNRLRLFMEKEINLGELKYRITGTSFLIDKTDDYIVESILKGLLVAIVSVALLMLLVTQSFKVMLISIAPNVLPLVILSGIMGWMGVELNIATAIIFSIAFGIAVDDSIHFITRYQLELKKADNKTALRNTYLSTGKSIILTSAVLFVGFIVFLFSGFSATFYIGLFVSITFVVALVADLTLLPVLLSFRKKD